MIDGALIDKSDISHYILQIKSDFASKMHYGRGYSGSAK